MNRENTSVDIASKIERLNDYVDRLVPIDRLSAVLSVETHMLEPVTTGTTTDYAFTQKGEKLAQEITDSALNPKWEQLTPYMFALWGQLIMPKSTFLDYARWQLIMFFNFQETSARNIADHMGYSHVNTLDMVQSVSFFSAYACLEKFKREKPQLLEENLDPQEGKVLVYKDSSVFSLCKKKGEVHVNPMD